MDEETREIQGESCGDRFEVEGRVSESVEVTRRLNRLYEGPGNAEDEELARFVREAAIRTLMRIEW
jgi:hypothetical protein